MTLAILEVDGRDLSCHALFPIVVTRGRDHPAESFAPATLTLNLDGVHYLSRGAYVYLTMPAPASNLRWETALGTWPDQHGTWLDQRTAVEVFRGRVTDLSTTWDPTAPRKWRTTTKLTALDPVGELVNVPVGDTPWPAESAADRAARITALLPGSWVIDPAPMMLAPRDVDAQPALALLDELAQTASATGGVWFDPNTLTAHVMSDASRPRDTKPTVTVNACDLLPDAEWLEQVGDVVNDATVTYRDAATPSTVLEARSRLELLGDSAGRRHETITTTLTSAADASARAIAHTSRYGRPTPRLRSLTLTSKSATSRDAAERILKAIPTDLVRVLELPPPAPGEWLGFVEGWALTLLDPDTYAVTVNLSPSVWSGLFLAWDQVGSPVRLDSAAWLKPAGWSWLGYGYGYPGGKVSAVHAGLAIEWGAPPQQPTDTAQQMAARSVEVTAGHTYRITAGGTLTATCPRVRLSIGYTASGPWSVPGSAGQPLALSYEWTATTSGRVLVGIQSEQGQPQTGGVTLSSFTMTDLTASGGGRTWADLDPSGRWFDASADLTWK